MSARERPRLYAPRRGPGYASGQEGDSVSSQEPVLFNDQEEITTLREELATLREEFDSLTSDLTAKISEQQQDIIVLQNSVKALMADKRHHEREILDLQEEVQRLSEANDNFSEQIRSYEAQPERYQGPSEIRSTRLRSSLIGSRNPSEDALDVSEASSRRTGYPKRRAASRASSVQGSRSAVVGASDMSTSSRSLSRQKHGRINIPFKRNPLHGIIAFLSRQCQGNVHDCRVVIVTSSGPVNAQSKYAAKNIVDLEVNSYFFSSYHEREEDIPDTPNNWICYDFQNRRILTTHYSLRSYCDGGVDGPNLKSWFVETSVDGRHWTEIDYREPNSDLNDANAMCTFPVRNPDILGRFIRLVNIGRNHSGYDNMVLSSWEIFGVLIEDITQ